MKCRHKGCKTEHKSTTGYCYEHAADIDKHVSMPFNSGRPKLYEEYLDDATTPKRTLK